MKALPRQMASYLARNVLLATLAAWAVLLTFDAILALFGELRDVGKESYTLGDAVMFTLLTIPRRLYEEFPTIAVIGTLLGLGGLAARSELTAMRAVGVSKLQMGVSVLIPLLVLTATMMLNIETLGPFGEQQAQALANLKSRQLMMARYSGLWAREGNLYFNARGNSAPHHENGSTWIELQDVRLYQFDPQGRLQSLARADRAEHRKAGWTLFGVERTFFEARSVRVEKIASERWQTELDDSTLEATLARPRYLSSAELRSNIEYLRRNHLDALKFESAYWARWFYPLNVIVLCLATLPFAFGSLRSGGFGKRLFIGILIGIGALVVQRMFVNLADVYRIDVRLAFLLPPLLVWALCWGWLAKKI